MFDLYRYKDTVKLLSGIHMRLNILNLGIIADDLRLPFARRLHWDSFFVRVRSCSCSICIDIKTSKETDLRGRTVAEG